MVFRWKEVKFSQNCIDKFFVSYPPHPHTILRVKIRRKNAFFSKSHKNAVISVFWHAEFISALKTELNPTVFEKIQKKKKISNNRYFLFFFFCDFL